MLMLICCFPPGWKRSMQFGFDMNLHGLSSFCLVFFQLEDDNPHICWFHVYHVVFRSHGVRFLLFILECYEALCLLGILELFVCYLQCINVSCNSIRNLIRCFSINYILFC